ncbi:MAG: SRPBCC family protein [Marinibacterium sp.]
MKFSTKEDVEAPIDHVFSRLADFEAHERAAVRRGVEVRRVDTAKAPGVGMSWRAIFDLRGRQRDAEIVVSEFDMPNRVRFQSMSQGLSGDMIMDLVPLSRNRTRIAIEIDLKPKSMPARLLIQSLKITKKTLTKRFKLRVADYARNMEDGYARKQGAGKPGRRT